MTRVTGLPPGLPRDFLLLGFSIIFYSIPSFLFTAHVIRFGLAGVAYSNISLLIQLGVSHSSLPTLLCTVHVITVRVYDKAVIQDNVSCRQPITLGPSNKILLTSCVAPCLCLAPTTLQKKLRHDVRCPTHGPTYTHSHSPEIHGSLFFFHSGARRHL